MELQPITWVIPFAGLAAVAFALYLARDVLQRDTGTEAMREIAGTIFEGAVAFIRRQYLTIGLLAIGGAVVIGVVITVVEGETVADTPIFGFDLGWRTAVAFLVGAACSMASGIIGMYISVKANVRTAAAAQHSLVGAVSPPAWLADSTAILLSGLAPGAVGEPAAGEPLPALDPATLGLTDDQLGSLGVARLDRGATSVVRLAHSDGASRPATSGDGRYLYVVVEPGQRGAGGLLRLTSRGGGTSFPVLRDGGAAVTSAAFGPEPGTVVAARTDDGIWLVDVASGSGEQLADDGWQPRWLP